MMDCNTEDVNSENLDVNTGDQQSEYISLDHEENTANSVDASRDSAESDADEKCEKSDSLQVRPTFKSILQAKKRLQAYSFTKVAKKPTKDEKNDEVEKSEKNTPKKPRKSQPLDRAKAVMEEIEEIKRQEMRDEMVKQELIAASVKLIEANRRSRSRSSSPGRDRQFKRREIKSRNYRRTDSSNRRSASPDDRRRSRRASPSYPKNWTEYVQQKMTVKKDIELKLKRFPPKKLRHYEMFKKCFSFSTPSPIIEPFKYSALNSEMKETPLSFIRYTRSCPTVSYNVNFKNVKESCVSRSQLFTIIPYEKRQTLEKFYSLTKSLPSSKKLKTRDWYNKSWKSKSDADCKILENSVGLSFLQNYSDQEDEENETEDIIICSSTHNKVKSNISEDVQSVENIDSTIAESPVLDESKISSPPFEKLDEKSQSPMGSIQENYSPSIIKDEAECDRMSNTSKIEDKDSGKYSPDIDKDMDENGIEDYNADEKNLSGNFTPDNTEFCNENVDELEETKKTIEKLELELQERQDNVKEKPAKTKKKKKVSKVEKAGDTLSKSKRKKKVKRKQSTSSTDESSSEGDKKKQKNKKSKQKKRTSKKSPVKKKRKTKKESKVKKKEKSESDEDTPEKPKRKRKRIDSSSESDDRKHSKKSKKSKKKKKSSKDSDSDEKVKTSDPVEKDDNEWEDIEEEVLEKDEPNRTSVSKTKENNFVIEIDDLEDNLKLSSDLNSVGIELNIDKRYLQRSKDKDVEPTLSDNILCLPKSLDVKKEPDWEYTPDRSENNDGREIFQDESYYDEQKTPQTENSLEKSNVNKLPVYNSWESDEEEFSTRKKDVQEEALLGRLSNESLDLEIPLNIKPFKKRDVTEYDIFRESNAEVKETKQTKEILEVTTSVKPQVNEPVQVPQSTVVEAVKKGRWDRRDSLPKMTISNSKLPTNLEPVKEDVPSINPIKSAVLENEYEQFMKALTSNVSESNDSMKNSSNSSSTFGFTDAEPKIEFKSDFPANVNVEKKVFTELPIILPKDVPLIPIPSDIKPIPVPSPKLKVEENANSLINIPLSPKVAIDVSFKLKPPSMDLVSPKKEESKLNSESELKSNTSENNVSLVSSTKTEISYFDDLCSISLPPENTDKIKESTPTSSSLVIKSDVPFENIPVVSSVSAEVPEKKDKPFVFVGMTLPSKKFLLDKSKVNLDDSDDDDIKNKSLQKLEELESVIGTKVNEEEDHQLFSKERLNVQQISLKDQNFEQTKPFSPQHRLLKEMSSRRSNSPKLGRHSPRNRRSSPHRRHDASPRRHGSPRRRTPDRRYAIKSNTSPRRKRDYSPRKRSVSPRRRSISPRRRSMSPRRRGGSPRRKRSVSPRRRGSPSRRRSMTPKRRHGSPRKRFMSPMRSNSPRDKHSVSPRRKRIPSPRERPDISPSATTKRRRSKSPDHFTSLQTYRPKSPPPIASPLQGPKRSVADSTISDDLLPQPSCIFDEHNDSPIASYHQRVARTLKSPKRMPLDVRINEVLGIKTEPKVTVSSTYNAYAYHHEHYQQSGTIAAPINVYSSSPNVSVLKSKGSFVQVGNMVQIVPSELPIKIDIPPPQAPVQHTQKPINLPTENMDPVHQEKSKIVQVGNMLQIVPSTLPAQEIAKAIPEIKKEIITETKESVICDKPTIEIPIKLKTAESRAEKEKRRKERELRRAEKEKKRKEREKKRQIKLKQKTEEMIKRALQMETEELEEEEETAFIEPPMQWPPLSVTVPGANKEVGKSILVQAGVSRKDSNKLDKRKIVQFADGVKPGEGTSPSGGEELMSPPPSKKLPKEKRYKKTKLFKGQKKKVKVKIIKKLPKPEESDEEDDLPPPSPPPGSPPSHIFPPRVKMHTLNNVRAFLANMVQSHQNQPQMTLTPPLNILMGHQSAILQPPPLTPSSTMVMAHHVPVTSVPPPNHHGAPSAVPTLLHHAPVPAVIPPMHHSSVPLQHLSMPHPPGPPPGSLGPSHPHASFHF